MALTLLGIIFRRTLFCLNKRDEGIANETGLTQIVNISPTMSDFSTVIDGLQKTGFLIHIFTRKYKYHLN